MPLGTPPVLTLPNELLEYIFSLLKWNFHQRLTVSTVCRHFHTLIWTTPIYWADMRDVYRPRQADICLERSRNAGLDVKVHFLARGTQSMDSWSIALLEKLVSHCHRWKTVHISLCGHYGAFDGTGDDLLKFGMLLKGLRMVVLQSIEWHLPRSDQRLHDVRERIEHDAAYHVYSTWTAPNLRYFYGHNMIPLSITPVHRFTSQLSTCRLNFGYQNWQHPENSVKHLLDFLSAQVALEHLELDMICFPDRDGSYTQVVLPSLHTLSAVGLDASERSLNNAALALPNILRHLVLPVIQSMEISVDINQPRSSSELDIASMFPACNDYLALTRLHMRINDSCEVKATLAPLYTLLRRFPSVRHLDICGLPIVGEYAEYAFQPPPLRTLHVSDFGLADTPASLQQFLRFLSRASTWGDFEVMVVHKGRDDVISVEELAQFLPEHKIRVREPGDESSEFEA